MELKLKKVFAKNLRLFRDSKGVSQDHLAEASGIAKSTLSKIENEMPNISIDTMERIANGLGIKLSEFLDEGSKEKKAEKSTTKKILKCIKMQNECKEILNSLV